MKNPRVFWGIVALLFAVLTFVFVPKCNNDTAPCNLPEPRSVRIDSFPNGKAYLSWSQVAGNSGYRIKVLVADSPVSVIVLRDTSVGINDTNVVIANLPINTVLEFQVSAKCPPNDSSSTFFGTTKGASIVIIDEIVMGRDCPTNTVPCDVMDDKDNTLDKQSESNKTSYTINNFINNVGSSYYSYYILISNGTNAVSEFRILYGLGQNGAFGIEGSCGVNPLKMAYLKSSNTYEWTEPTGGSKIRFIINNNNSVTLETDANRDYSVESSTSYATTCKNN
jgi:hypothetical protein